MNCTLFKSVQGINNGSKKTDFNVKTCFLFPLILEDPDEPKKMRIYQIKTNLKTFVKNVVSQNSMRSFDWRPIVIVSTFYLLSLRREMLLCIPKG